jgi:hypothetical protein
MSKNTQIGELINYISVDGSGNVVLSTGQLVATQNYVGTAISNLVASAPSTLDTLNELATALGNDANFATTVATSIGTKQPQLNGTGFVKVTGTTVSYDNSTYLTTDTGSSTYVPYTGATADLVLGTNNLKSKNTFVEGDGSYNGGGLRIKQYVSQADGIDNYNTISSQSSGFAFSSSFGGGVFKNFILDASSLTNTTQRVYTLPNASGTLALTSNIPTNNNTLTNGAGYITSYTETDTLASVTGRGATTSTAITISNTVTATGFYSTTGSNFATSSGRVGVGTTTPADKFVVSNSGAEGIEFGFDAGVPYLFGYNRSTSAYKPIAFVGSGNVIITQGTIVDNGSKLQVTGAATFSSSGANGITLAADSNDTNNSGRLFFIRTGGEGWAIFNNAQKLSFRNGSIPGNTSGTERMYLDSSGNLLPGADATYNLGSTSLRWNNVYTTDLHLSNEGKQNVVDGTWGDWTLQEGENDIFMLNNRSGEKFKIKLEKI